MDTFFVGEPSNQIYMLTGVRGAGKTVMMANIASEIKKVENWIVVELNPTRDLLQSLTTKLYSLPEMYPHFIQAKLDFSAFGLGVSLENAIPVTDIENAIELMLAEIQKKQKRLLITMILEPLNYTAVRKHYMDIFGLDMKKAEEMTGLTKGYPFAFQVLGYLFWENRAEKTIEEILPEYDQYLEEYVYAKIWSELSELDRKILIEMAVSGETKVKKIRDRMKMKSELFSVYRDRLKRKGVLNTGTYGEVSFILPRFAEFVTMQMI